MVALRLASMVILPVTPSKIFRRGERVADFWAVGRAGALDGVGQDHGRIVAQRGHGVGRFAVIFALLVIFHEILHAAVASSGEKCVEK